jgi:hypothetical protein
MRYWIEYILPLSKNHLFLGSISGHSYIADINNSEAVF